MHIFFRQNITVWLKGGGAILAAAAVALFSLFPAARLFGFLLVLVASLLFWASWHNTDHLGRQGLFRTPLDVPIFLLLVQVGATFWATALPDKTWIAVCQLLSGLVAYYTVVLWSRDRVRLWWAIVALVLLGLGLALIAPFAVDWFQERKTFLPSTLYKFFPLLLPDPIHPNVIAGSLVTLLPLPLAISLALTTESRRRLWLKIALLTICLCQVFILVLTKSRGGYIALGVGLWLTLWLSNRRRWAIGLILLTLVLGVWLLICSSSEVNQAYDPTQAALDASTWSFRQQVWRVAILTIGDFPFTGTGMGTFNDVAEVLYGFYAPNNPQAHNLFLQVAVDLGLLGLISYLAILLIVLWCAFQAYRLFDARQERTLQAVAIGGLAGVAATVAHGLVDSHTWGSKGAFIPWALMGLVVALYTWSLKDSATDDQLASNPL